METPFEPFSGKASCTEDCHAVGPDGYMDLTFKFDAQSVIGSLGEIEDGQCFVLTLIGELKEECGRTASSGEAVVVIIK